MDVNARDRLDKALSTVRGVESLLVALYATSESEDALMVCADALASAVELIEEVDT